jgi:hypothetical protein
MLCDDNLETTILYEWLKIEFKYIYSGTTLLALRSINYLFETVIILMKFKPLKSFVGLFWKLKISAF